MKFKKTLTTLAATGLITAALAAPALAKDIVYPPTPSTTPLPTSMSGESAVNAKVTQTYTVVIPDTVSFGDLDKNSLNVEKDLTVKVSNLLIDKNQALKINVKGDDPTTSGAFTIRTKGGASIAYEVYNKSGAKVEPNSAFATATTPPPRIPLIKNRMCPEHSNRPVRSSTGAIMRASSPSPAPSPQRHKKASPKRQQKGDHHENQKSPHPTGHHGPAVPGRRSGPGG